MQKVFESWESVEQLSRKLAGKVTMSGFNPEILVAIIRGGLFPALVISHELDNKELYAVKCIHYDEAECKKAELVFQQDLPKELCAGKRVLLIDEIADSGESLEMVREILERQKPKEIRTAVLHCKPSSKVIPDYFEKQSSEWIVYPWERKETGKKGAH